jgi:1-acyl-sn-glycerol-3-phosphate acyltransferase
MLAEAQRWTADGRPLITFPEGTRTRHGRAAPLRSGFAGLDKLLGPARVVPLAAAIAGRSTTACGQAARGRSRYRIGRRPSPPACRGEAVERASIAAINVLNP